MCRKWVVAWGNVNILSDLVLAVGGYTYLIHCHLNGWGKTSPHYSINILWTTGQHGCLLMSMACQVNLLLVACLPDSGQITARLIFGRACGSVIAKEYY